MSIIFWLVLVYDFSGKVAVDIPDDPHEVANAGHDDDHFCRLEAVVNHQQVLDAVVILVLVLADGWVLFNLLDDALLSKSFHVIQHDLSYWNPCRLHHAKDLDDVKQSHVQMEIQENQRDGKEWHQIENETILKVVLADASKVSVRQMLTLWREISKEPLQHAQKEEGFHQ